MYEQSDNEQRLAEAETTLDALRCQEVDAIVGSQQVMLLRLRETENKLRESEQRFRVLVEAISQAVWETDQHGMVVEESPTWLDYTGQAAGDAVGDGWLNAIHPDDRPAFERTWKNAVEFTRNLDAEFRLRSPDGSWRWTHVRAAPMRDADGNITKWAGMNVDITKQKALEESLLWARDAAEAANRSRGEFLANMSHEIRTPMTAILGYADILNERLENPDDLHCLETVRRNGRFLLEVINDILDLSKIDADKLQVDRERVCPGTLIGEVVALMQVRAQEKQLPLSVHCEGPVPTEIETDRVRFRQILLNLLGNAIKFTEKGEVRVVVRYVAPEKRMELDVIDTGKGIHEEDLDRLFHPFAQANDSATHSSDGTGLGLTISRRLAQALGGDISVRSRPQHGSTFTLSIDCGEHVETQIGWPELEVVSPADASQDGTRIDGDILVVDDRRDMRFLAERFVTKAGGNVVTANDGMEAIEKIEQREQEGRPIDLVLMDMQMPQMDGFETTRQLRRNGFHRPIIALTANAMNGDHERCLKAGCTDYAPKPLDGPKLVRMILHHLSNKLALVIYCCSLEIF